MKAFAGLTFGLTLVKTLLQGILCFKSDHKQYISVTHNIQAIWFNNKWVRTLRINIHSQFQYWIWNTKCANSFFQTILFSTIIEVGHEEVWKSSAFHSENKSGEFRFAPPQSRNMPSNECAENITPPKWVTQYLELIAVVDG